MPAIAVNPEQIFQIEVDREEDGRWIADIPAIPGVIVYGNSEVEAIAKAQALALRVIADQIEANATPTDQVRFAHCA